MFSVKLTTGEIKIYISFFLTANSNLFETAFGIPGREIPEIS